MRPENWNFWLLTRSTLLLLIAGSFLPRDAEAQSLDSLTQGYPESLCASCAEWNAPVDPFRIFSNAYYVGTRGLSAILITSEDGHVLIDGALPNSAPMILENIRSMGFEPAEVELLLNSHAHFDHAGGLAALQQVTGARVAASPASASVLEQGRSGPDDPQYGLLPEIPRVERVERFMPGDTLQVGSLHLISHRTAGHTPGGTSWSWRTCEAERCLTVVYADSQSPVSAPGFRFTDSETYPDAVADLEEGHRTLEKMQCDILITTHPGAASLWSRLERNREGLVDAQACRRYAAAARQQLLDRLRGEARQDRNQD